MSLLNTLNTVGFDASDCRVSGQKVNGLLHQVLDGSVCERLRTMYVDENGYAYHPDENK